MQQAGRLVRVAVVAFIVTLGLAGAAGATVSNVTANDPQGDASSPFLLPPAASPAVTTKLFAYVNEPNEPYNGIWLKDANGALVTNLGPGTYEIDVDDRSGGSSFHLKGPGVDIATRLEAVVHTTWP